MRTFVGVLFPVRFEGIQNILIDRWLSGFARSHSRYCIQYWCRHFERLGQLVTLALKACDSGVTAQVGPLMQRVTLKSTQNPLKLTCKMKEGCMVSTPLTGKRV
jgi:hypothetical protein